MAIKGLSKFVFGKYKDNAGDVSYSDPINPAHAIEYQITIQKTEDNPLFGDNRIIENDKGVFKNGEIRIKTSDLSLETSKYILGLKETNVSYGPNDSQKQTKVLYYDDEADSPFLGAGLVELHQVDNVDLYKAIFLHKVYFNIPNDAAVTKGEKIEWQTKELTGIINRSDEKTKGKFPWKSDAWFTTEEEAFEYLEYMCGKPTA